MTGDYYEWEVTLDIQASFISGIWKGERWDRADLCLRSIVFFWKRPSLMFYPSYQNCGPKDDSGITIAFFKTNYWVN